MEDKTKIDDTFINKRKGSPCEVKTLDKSEEFNVDWSKYYKYDELTDILENLSKRYPELAKLSPVGKSSEGRNIWLMEITNPKTGSSEKKPGFWIDGNTHHSEVAGSTAALYTIWYLLTNYQKDPFVTELVDSTTFYILPRVDVDGAELYLTMPHYERTLTKYYPLTKEEWEAKEGLVPEDINRDGYITQMRIEDPNGDWKISDKDPRIMVRRDVDEKGGTYYRILREGLIRNYQGKEIKTAPPRYDVNLNRQFPGDWTQETRSSGPIPISEPETRAIADFWLRHPNIAGLITYHTSGGIIIRAFDGKPDTEFIPQDLETFKAIGNIGTKLLGYPCISSFEEYTRDKKRPIAGTTDGWAYINRGVFGFCIELWDVAGRAGLGGWRERGGIKFRSDKEENALKLMEWNDKELGGKGFINWTRFDHPQLGTVEIGGWDPKFFLLNPPEKVLEDEVKKTFIFSLKFAELLPHVKITETKVTSIAGNLFKIAVTVENQGFLPTNISEQAKRIGRAKPVIAKIELGENAELVTGREWVELGDIRGRTPPESLRPATEETRKKVEWLIKVNKLTEITISVISEKAGTQEGQIEIKP